MSRIEAPCPACRKGLLCDHAMQDGYLFCWECGYEEDYVDADDDEEYAKECGFYERTEDDNPDDGGFMSQEEYDYNYGEDGLTG